MEDQLDRLEDAVERAINKLANSADCPEADRIERLADLQDYISDAIDRIISRKQR
jgi:hypothetical protein